MNKALFQKQLRELLAIFLRKNRKSKRNSGKGSIVLYALVMMYAFGIFVWLFLQVSSALCEPLVAAGMGWLYFAMLGLMATAVGIYGCIFNVQSSVYQAKDNDLLLSMPIPPGKIIVMRLGGCFAMVFLMELIVMVPAEAVWIQVQGVQILQILLFILTMFLLPLLSLAIACVLGWLLALGSRNLQDKNLFNVIFSVLFLVVFFLLYFRANTYLRMILSNPADVGGRVQAFVYPLYKMGQGLTGSLTGFLLFALIALVVFALVYKLLSGTFLRLATAPGNTKKKVYKGGPMKIASAKKALMRKELRHFRNSSTYILNSCLGTLFMVAFGVFLLVKQGWIRYEIGYVIDYYSELTALFACALLLFMAGSNELTAPSISLEGRSIWVLQSMPVDAFQVLWTKIKLHLLMTMPPAAFVTAAVFVLIRPTYLLMVLIALIVALNILFDAIFGLLVNLRLPNLEWNDETTAIKQSGAAILSLLGNWALLFVLALVYVIIGRKLGLVIFMSAAAVILAAVCAGMLIWLKKKGAAKFATL